MDLRSVATVVSLLSNAGCAFNVDVTLQPRVYVDQAFLAYEDEAIAVYRAMDVWETADLGIAFDRRVESHAALALGNHIGEHNVIILVRNEGTFDPSCPQESQPGKRGLDPVGDTSEHVGMSWLRTGVICIDARWIHAHPLDASETRNQFQAIVAHEIGHQLGLVLHEDEVLKGSTHPAVMQSQIGPLQPDHPTCRDRIRLAIHWNIDIPADCRD